MHVPLEAAGGGAWQGRDAHVPSTSTAVSGARGTWERVRDDPGMDQETDQHDWQQ